MKLDRYRIQHITIKMNQDIKELKTMKLLGENTGGNLRDTGFDSDFSGYDTQKAQARQEKDKIKQTTKIKKSVHSKTFSTQQKRISQNDRKYL